MSKCITVSVVSHAHDNALRRLLTDLATYSFEDVLQVIVTLNIPSSSMLAWIHAVAWPFEIEVLINKVPKGFSRNHNDAFKLSKGQFYCVLNPDIELDVNPFLEMKFLFSDGNVGCVYPLQVTTSSIPKDYKRIVPSPWSLLARHCHIVPDLDKNLPAIWVNASFLLFSRDAYADLSGFDERYFMYCEDVDICLRLNQQGYRLALAEKVIVIHRASFASRKSFRHLLWHLVSLFRLWASPVYKEYLRECIIWRKKFF